MEILAGADALPLIVTFVGLLLVLALAVSLGVSLGKSGRTPESPESTNKTTVWGRLTRPGTLLNSSPLMLVGLIVAGFAAAKWLPLASPLLFLLGTMAFAGAAGVAAILAIDRYLVQYNLIQAIQEKNVAAALLYVAFALPVAAAVLGVALLGITVVTGAGQ